MGDDLRAVQIDPPYSPNLASSDYHYFSASHLGGTIFRTDGELKDDAVRYLRTAAGEFYDTGIFKKIYTAFNNASIAMGIM